MAFAVQSTFINFIPTKSENLSGILQFLQKGTNKAKLKQVGKNGILVVEDLKEMKDLWKFLKRMKEAVAAVAVLV